MSHAAGLLQWVYISLWSGPPVALAIGAVLVRYVGHHHHMLTKLPLRHVLDLVHQLRVVLIMLVGHHHHMLIRFSVTC